MKTPGIIPGYNYIVQYYPGETIFSRDDVIGSCWAYHNSDALVETACTASDGQGQPGLGAGRRHSHNAEMPDLLNESLSHDVIHGYIPFISPRGLPQGEVAEQRIIDDPWVQRLRQIHQLQTAWWVYPTAEHTRFQHVLGAMLLAGRAIGALYDSLREVLPRRAQPRLRRVAHAVWPHCCTTWAMAPSGTFSIVITWPNTSSTTRSWAATSFAMSWALSSRASAGIPIVASWTKRRWIQSRSVSSSCVPAAPGPTTGRSGSVSCAACSAVLYTVDNMDFVLRDAYMSGYSTRAFDLDRLLRYSLFTARGLTIHERGQSALVQFISVRGELFRTVYYHRTVRAIDLSLQELFIDSKHEIFPGNPLDHLDEYQRLTEWSLLVRVADWHRSADPKLRAVGAAGGGNSCPGSCDGRWPASGSFSSPLARPRRPVSSVTRRLWSGASASICRRN